MKILKSKRIRMFFVCLLAVALFVTASLVYFSNTTVRVRRNIYSLDSYFTGEKVIGKPVLNLWYDLYVLYNEEPEKVHYLVKKGFNNKNLDIHTRVVLLTFMFNENEKKVREQISENFNKKISIDNYKSAPYTVFPILFPEIFPKQMLAAIPEGTIQAIRQDFNVNTKNGFVFPAKIYAIRNPAQYTDIVLPDEYTKDIDPLYNDKRYWADLIAIDGIPYEMKTSSDSIAFSFEKGRWVGNFYERGKLKGAYTFKIVRTPKQNNYRGSPLREADGPTFTITFENTTGIPQVIVPELHFKPKPELPPGALDF